jgi:NADH-quinone oxidoreductase subunit L
VFAGAMLVTVTASDLLTMLRAWEVMGATSWALIAHWWHEERRRAANTAFWTTRLADVGLYLAAGAALAGAGTLGFAALPGLDGGVLATACVIVAALGKSAQLPFSFWLSRASRSTCSASRAFWADGSINTLTTTSRPWS